MQVSEPEAPRGDLLVIFGITGDLARVMTFRSLYRLEQRGLLDCPILGVAFDDWSLEQLHERARTSIVAAGERLDIRVFERLCHRLGYVHGDFADPATYDRVRDAMGRARHPVFYLETPPNLFAAVVTGLAHAGLAEGARFVIEKPFGHDLPSARALAAELHDVVDESQLYRIDHYLGKLGLEEILYLRFANTMLEPVWNRNHVECVQITMAEDFGIDGRGGFYDPVGALRDVVVNHLMQVLAAVAMEAPAHGDVESIRTAQTTLFRSITDADPARCVRGQVTGYRDVAGVAADSTTETFCALELGIENWRWSGVPFFIRAGKLLPVTQTEVRLVFRPSPQLGFGLRTPESKPDQLVIRLDPSTGVRIMLNARRADAALPASIDLDMEFADAGGEGPTPYEVLLLAAIEGRGIRFGRQETIEAAWRVMQPLIDAPPSVLPYAPGTWGPDAANALVAAHGGWREPWV